MHEPFIEGSIVNGYNIYLSLKKNGFNIKVLTHSWLPKNKIKNRKKDIIIYSENTNSKRMFQSRKEMLLDLPIIMRYISKMRPNVIILNKAPAFYSFFIKLLYPKVKILSILYHSPNKKEWRRRRIFYKYFIDKIIVISHHLKQSLLTRKIKKNKVIVVYPFIEQFKKLNRKKLLTKYNLNKNIFYFGYVGQPHNDRGVMQLINFIKKTKLNHVGLLLFIPRITEEINNAIKGQNNIKIMHNYNKEDMYYLPNVLIFLYSKNFTAIDMPLTLLEALSIGAFVVVSDISQFKEIIKDRINGVILKSNKNLPDVIRLYKIYKNKIKTNSTRSIKKIKDYNMKKIINAIYS